MLSKDGVCAKARVAVDAGAVGVIIVDSAEANPADARMPPELTPMFSSVVENQPTVQTPVVMVSHSDGERLKTSTSFEIKGQWHTQNPGCPAISDARLWIFSSRSSATPGDRGRSRRRAANRHDADGAQRLGFSSDASGGVTGPVRL